MQLFGLFCVSAYCVASLIVGVRLLRLARRTGEIPELMIGSCFISGGLIGFPASVAAQLLVSDSPDLARWMAMAYAVGLAIAAACILVAWWKIYHSASRWGPWVVSVWMAFLAGACVSQLGRPLAELTPGAGPWQSLRAVVQGGAYAAIAFSGFRYHVLLRRRLRLGLADPVVANRIWLWSVAAFLVTLQYGYTLAIPWLSSLFDAVSVAPAFVGTLGVLIALSITHAFYPPQRYLRWIEKRAGAEVD
jgi:hypothetical protein